MSLELPASNLSHRASRLLADRAWDQAIALCESEIAADPSSKQAYWYLGLTFLLQGQEAEANFTWAAAIAEGEADEIAAWTEELQQVLHAEAMQWEAQGLLQEAWMIRQGIRSLDPADVNNLLHLLQLSLRQDCITSEELADLNLIAILKNQPAPVNITLLWDVVQQLLERMVHKPLVKDMVAASLPYIKTIPTVIKTLLEKAIALSKLIGNNTLACRYGELCLQIDPRHAETLLRLAGFYQDEGEYLKGIAVAQQYFAGCQTLLQKVMGNAIILRGLMTAGARWQEAEAVIQLETELLRSLISDHLPDPNNPLDASILAAPLFFYPYFNDSPQETRALQNQLAHLYETSFRTHINCYNEDYQPYPQVPPKRQPSRQKLRIGYLSRCMRRHSVGWLSRWVFRYFDRERFEVYAYFNHQERIAGFAKTWFADPATQACCFTGDALGIATAIQDDEIDILVDLDSITSDYTCAVMALKPAPIQVTWLGLDASGLPAIDYFLADPYVLPDQAADYYAEQIWRLPQTYIAVDGFEVGVPTLRRDQLGIPTDAVTYLSAQSAYKRHPHTIRLQLQVLREVPNSYFLIKGAGDQKGLQAFFEQLAEEEGIASDRLKFLPWESSEENHRANLQLADVVLDTFPYNGATTTLETLWMGVPLVTRVGQQFAARNSYTMMVNAGVQEGIAWTDEEYVEWGIRLGKDAALRQQVMTGLRRSRQRAPLWNAQQFTRDLEAAYTQMWEKYQG